MHTTYSDSSKTSGSGIGSFHTFCDPLRPLIQDCAKLEATVIPFILRGVNLLGINAVDTPRDIRVAVWQRLATDLKPRHLDKIVTGEVDLAHVTDTMQDWIEGHVTGRRLVSIG